MNFRKTTSMLLVISLLVACVSANAASGDDEEESLRSAVDSRSLQVCREDARRMDLIAQQRANSLNNAANNMASANETENKFQSWLKSQPAAPTTPLPATGRSLRHGPIGTQMGADGRQGSHEGTLLPRRGQDPQAPVGKGPSQPPQVAPSCGPSELPTNELMRRNICTWYRSPLTYGMLAVVFHKISVFPRAPLRLKQGCELLKVGSFLAICVTACRVGHKTILPYNVTFTVRRI